MKIQTIIRNYMMSFLLLAFGYALSLAGCSTQPAQMATPESMTSSPMPLRATPTEKSPVMSIPLSSTPTAQNVLTPTPEPNPDAYEFVKACIPVATDLSKKISSRDGVILFDIDRPQSKQTFLLDMSHHKEIEFGKEHENLSNFAVSPNHQWVAYFVMNTDEPRLVVRNFVTGKILEMPFPFEKSWGKIFSWINNDQILIGLASNVYPPPFVLFNPFTKNEISVPSTFPDQQTLSGTTRLPLAAYDPSTNKVVYLWSRDKILGLALYDSTQTRQIAFFPSLSFVMVAPPQWNSDGTKFAVSFEPLTDEKDLKYSFELLISDANGNAHQVTQLGQQIVSFYINSLAWSPNNRYIAFVIQDLDYGQKLMFLDMLNKKTIDPCIDLGSGGSNFPIWSPNGDQLVIRSQADNDQILLVDLTLMSAEILASGEQLDVDGWVALKP